MEDAPKYHRRFPQASCPQYLFQLNKPSIALAEWGLVRTHLNSLSVGREVYRFHAA